MALTKIKTSGIADNAITNAKMADDAIDSADFADASIDLAHMSVNSIDSDQYVDGSIDNVHLAGSIAVSKTLLAGGTGLTLSTNTLAVDAAQTQITSVGTIGTGVWNAGTITATGSDSSINTFKNSNATAGAGGLHSAFKLLDAEGDLQADWKMNANDGGQINIYGSDHSTVKTRIEGGDGNNSYFNNGGSVGIGTANPSSSHAKANKLVVGSGSACGIGLWAGANEGWYAFSRDNANNTDAYDGGMSYDGSRNLKFHTNAGATRLTIDGSGRLGLGTTSPASYNGDTDDFVIAGTGAKGLTISSTNSTSSTINFADGTSGSEPYIGTIAYDHSSDTMWFRTNASQAMFIKSDGKVGIGTSSPAMLLEVKTDSAEHLRLTRNASHYWDIQVGSNGSLSFQKNSATNDLVFDASSNATFGGDVIIQKSSSSHLYVDAGTSGGNASVHLRDENNTRMWELRADGGASDKLMILDTGGTEVLTLEQDNTATFGGRVTFTDGSAWTNGGRLSCNSNRINAGYAHDSEDHDMWINYEGYDDGTSRFRDFRVGNGKGGQICFWDGSDGVIDGDFNDTSDIAMKKAISEISSTLDKVELLKPSNFKWKASLNRHDRNNIGFIAQEVEEQFPDLVHGEEDRMAINTLGVVAILTKAVQELSAKVTALENA